MNANKLATRVVAIIGLVAAGLMNAYGSSERLEWIRVAPAQHSTGGAAG